MFNRLDDSRAGSGQPRPKAGTTPTDDRFTTFKRLTNRHLAYRDAYYRAQQSGVSLVSVPIPDAVRAEDVDEALAALEELMRSGGKTRIEADPKVDIQG